MRLTVENVKGKIVGILKKNGVRKASVFGSLATGEATKKSDVDILIEFRGKNKSLLDLVGLEQELEDKLHRKVDLLTFKSLHPLIRDRILAEQVSIL